MRPTLARSTKWTTLTLLPMVTVLLSGPRADAAEAEPPKSEAAAGGGSPTSTDPADTKPVPAETQSASFVEVLPGSAFPEPRVRGIKGGSLWMTFHGLQWPYITHTGIGISGSAWVDTGYERITSNSMTHANTVYQVQEARAVLRATPTYSDGSFFIQGQAELVANKNQLISQSSGGVVDTDDLWVRVGRWNLWDLQLGRYQGWEVYHLGMGLDLNTLERHGATDSLFGDPVDFYGVTHGWDRSSGVGNIGLHAYPTNFLRFELLGHAGFENQLNTLGTRPVAVLDFGIIKFKLGGEYRKGQGFRTTTDPASGNKIPGHEKLVQSGFGAGVQLVLAPYFEMGVNAARTIVDHNDSMNGSPDLGGSYTTTSGGGFANLSIGGVTHQTSLTDLILGLGADYTTKTNLQSPLAEKNTNLQAFGALQYLLAGHLYIKAVIAYDRGTWFQRQMDTNPEVVNKMLSSRIRVMYLF